MLKALLAFLDSPYTNLAIALILFYSGLSEAWDTLGEDMHHFRLRAHHGIMLFGLFHALKCLPDIFEGLERVRAKKPEA